MLISIWSIGFIYIILSEVFLIWKENSNVYALNALIFLIIANNTIIIGYYSKKSISYDFVNVERYAYSSKKFGKWLLILSVIFYVIMTWKNAVTSFALGRNTDTYGESFVIESVVSAMGLILPSIIVFYFYFVEKKSIAIPFFLSLPIFVIVFMSGTRFPLLFSFLGFFLTYQNVNDVKISAKRILIIGSAVLVLLSASSAMKEFRTGIKDNIVSKSSEVKYKDFPTYISQNFSNEGVIDMTALLLWHFESHEHLYGESSSFLLYFWVPREVWNDKPTMLGNWFIRQYRSGFASGHSSSFGFPGDLYADFGYFSLLFIFFIGRLIKRADNFKDKALASKSYSVILGAMLFPYIFLAVRSPITATMTFLGTVFFFYVFKRIVVSEKMQIDLK
jgi:oligosaccharide repeat unit polymerase